MSICLPLYKISYGPLVTSWCLFEYPGHPDGCRNYNDKEWCPEKAPLFPGNIDITNYNIIEGHNREMFLLKLKEHMKPTMWLFIRKFNLGKWARNLQKKHSHLSNKQARISYLWQDKIYNRVYADAETFRWTIRKPTILLKRPEGNGVNLFATCRINGGPQLEKNPQEIVYLMCMVGIAEVK